MAERDRLTREEGEELISLARKTIEAELFGGGSPPEEGMEITPEFLDKRGTFVTLTMNGGLRGCIGNIIPRESVLEGVKKNALNAAFEDPRFRPLTAEEWERVRVEVSILSDPRPLPYETPEDLLNKLKPGVHGVIIRKGMRQSTFLPQVWEQLPDKSEFLTHLCLKAGLDGDAWRKDPLEVFTYEVQAFEE
ncbi:MAG: AmmeMemoRadiSam system protein A [Thermodesulfobacteriota bacterium]